MSPLHAHSRSGRRSRSESSCRVRSATRADVTAGLGPRLRALRLRHGVGLRELARRLDLSPSAISRIETGKSQPSVRTLFAFASELQVSIDEVLSGPAESPASGRPATVRSNGSPATAIPGLELQRAGANPSIRLESGVRWKRLMLWPEDDLELIETTYEPDGASSPHDNLVRHGGHEFVYVLTGELRVVVETNELVLGPGDSLAFRSSTPHRLSNIGDQIVRAIWVVRGRRNAAGVVR